MLVTMWKRVRAQLSQPSTGIVCAFVTAALCGAGSILFKVFPNFYLRHLGGWWSAPRWHTLWASSLIVVAAAWCCHAMLRVHDSVPNRASPTTGWGWRLALTILQMSWVLVLGPTCGSRFALRRRSSKLRRRVRTSTASTIVCCASRPADGDPNRGAQSLPGSNGELEPCPSVSALIDVNLGRRHPELTNGNGSCESGQ